jgi:hypothetical protein
MLWRNSGLGDRYQCIEPCGPPEAPRPIESARSADSARYARYARYARHARHARYARYARYARCADHHAHTPPSGRFLGERAELPDRRGKHRQSLLG